MIKIIPKLDKVLVRALPEEERRKSGLWIPKTAQEQNRVIFRAKVVAVGPGKPDEKGVLVPMEARIDEIVVFPQYAGLELILEEEVNGETARVVYWLIRDSELWAEWVEEPAVTVESILGHDPKVN